MTRTQRPDDVTDTTVQPQATDPARVGPLVALAAAGDVSAFGELFELYVDAVYRYVLFRVREPQVARDLTQDVFEAVLRGLTTLDSPERFEGWLFTIAYRRVGSYWRRERLRERTASQTLDASLDLEDEPLSLLDQEFDAARVARSVAQLNPLQQEVLALRFVAGLSVRDSAAAMGRSDDALKKLQRRALAALRRCIQSGDEEAGR